MFYGCWIIGYEIADFTNVKEKKKKKSIKNLIFK